MDWKEFLATNAIILVIISFDGRLTLSASASALSSKLLAFLMALLIERKIRRIDTAIIAKIKVQTPTNITSAASSPLMAHIIAKNLLLYKHCPFNTTGLAKS
jgi:hypothetical protein